MFPRPQPGDRCAGRAHGRLRARRRHGWSDIQVERRLHYVIARRGAWVNQRAWVKRSSRVMQRHVVEGRDVQMRRLGHRWWWWSWWWWWWWPRFQLLQQRRRLRRLLHHRTHRGLRDGAPCLELVEFVERGGHHLLKVGELVRHVLNSRELGRHRLHRHL